MRIGLMLDMRNPDGRRDPTELYRSTLDRVVAAEAAGLDAVWTTEHHAAPDGYLPAPLMLLAAVAARTERLRLGTAIAVSPLRSTRMLAEEAAVLDVLSGGRVELGLGSGWDRREFDLFGADFDGRYRSLRRTIRELPELWRSGSVTPGPVQDPVPLWYGARGPVGARWAGRLGVGLLWLDRDLLDPYRQGLAEGGHDPAFGRTGGLRNVVLCDDPDRVRALVIDDARRARRATYTGAEPEGRPSALPRLMFRTPQDAAAELAADIAGAPVTDVFVLDRIGGMADDLVDRHVELLLGPFRSALLGHLG